MNRNSTMLGCRFYSPKLKNIAGLEGSGQKYCMALVFNLGGKRRDFYNFIEQELCFSINVFPQLLPLLVP